MVILILFGDVIFSKLGIPHPQWYMKLRESKFLYGMGAWFIGNMIVSNLLSSGAFEIYVNNDLIFSKL